MKLTKVIINNFRSFGDSQVIGFNAQTVLIGNNSSGKTTVLQALSKLFSDKQNDRIIRKSDFHLPKGNSECTSAPNAPYVDCGDLLAA